MASAGSAAIAINAVPRSKTLDDVRKLADQGDADAQWDMGYRYHNGQGVPQDDAQAVRWFQRAAYQGHVNSQATLGAYYWAGRGVPKDLGQAYFWSVVALHHGDRDSESRLRGLALQMTRAQIVAAQQEADDWLRRHRAAK
jgi:TPR repeat protein